MSPWKRRFLLVLNSIIFRFHVSFRGCRSNGFNGFNGHLVFVEMICLEKLFSNNFKHMQIIFLVDACVGGRTALESFHKMVSKATHTVATAVATIAFARYDLF